MSQSKLISHQKTKSLNEKELQSQKNAKNISIQANKSSKMKNSSFNLSKSPLLKNKINYRPHNDAFQKEESPLQKLNLNDQVKIHLSQQNFKMTQNFTNKSQSGIQSPILNPNSKSMQIKYSNKYFIDNMQSNHSSPKNLNQKSTGFSFYTNTQNTCNNSQDQLDNVINQTPKNSNMSKLLKKQLNNSQNQVNNNNNSSNIIQLQQQNNYNSQYFFKKNQHSKQNSLIQQESFNQKQMSQQVNNRILVLNQKQKRIFKNQQFQTFFYSPYQRQNDQFMHEQSEEIKANSNFNSNEIFNLNNSQNMSGNLMENSGGFNTFQQALSPKNNPNIQMNQSSVQNDKLIFKKRDSENDIFSTSRKEHRMVELMKQKIQNNVFSGYIFPKQEKLISRISYLTSKLNPYYEKTINLINDIENKKLQYGNETKQQQNDNFLIEMQQQQAQLNMNMSNQHNDEQDGIFNYINIKNLTKAESIELSHKQGCQNIIKAETLEFFYVYIQVKAMPTPIRVCFKTPISKLKVFISKSTIFPSKFQNDYILQSNVIRVDDGSNSQFTFDKLYFGILSEIEQEIRITIKFGMEKKTVPMITNKVKSQEQPDSFTQDFSRTNMKRQQRHISTPILAQDVAEIKQRRRMKLLHNQKNGEEKDFQQQNIQQVYYYNPDTHKTISQEKYQQFNQKHKEVTEKKRQMDEMQYYHKDYTMKIKDLQKQLNQTFSAINERKKEVIKFSNAWAKIILQILGFKILYQKIKRKSNYMRNQKDITIRIKLMIIRMQRQINKNYGNLSTEQKAIYNTREALEFFCKKFKKKSKQAAGKLVTNFLRNKKQFYSIEHYVFGYYNTINMIITRWRDFKIKRENFKRMLGFLFDKYFSKVLETISKTGTDKDDFFTIINNARRIEKVKTETTRQKFIECYLDRRKVEYSQDLFKYFKIFQQKNKKKLMYIQALMNKRKDEEIDFHSNKFDEVNEDKEKQIDQLLFNQVIQQKSDQSIIPPRYFIVPSYEVLKQVVCETFVKVKDEHIVKKLREEKIKKNWSEQVFLQKLIQNDDDITQKQV
ncbi:hypothetical protein TTHERM_00388530 (macronuclear) [Tetrahymena thermophila SB210]|uniref:Uncharacterized protein n=1 Tax=Tetrahymena thermophila (strain SB210) TaxID=312017 RepID=Q23RD6_TETTS|nr:hypothetical protein TTHERM_00388530 [Tetrahymena thermophila SB210]EAR99112.2 hypothetical protein TTHERM_00388530 [Tetrahymena thermophila SB210]|eukprot:XP_001019357.2 hypothetical protein TTHERM_00388530 [Tetrahymena thermophila SB210]